ncbi:MAG: hypothetical protein HYU63_07265 [Armatimonadetes bacterium]|nr:hypothetical protein [Armatimonadota bacterium]
MKKLSFYKLIINFLVLFLFASLSAQELPKIYFNREAQRPVLNLINQAKNSIEAEMFVLSDIEVIRALIQAKKRGVKIKILLDLNQKSSQKKIPEFFANGIEIKGFLNKKGILMHRKIALFDKKFLFLGSTNWTFNGFHKNQEVDLLLDDSKIIQEFLKQFKKDWEKGKKFSKENT